MGTTTGAGVGPAFIRSTNQWRIYDGELYQEMIAMLINLYLKTGDCVYYSYEVCHDLKEECNYRDSLNRPS